MTSDHRVAGSSPAGCMPSATTTYAEEQRPEESFAWTLLGHFLKYFCCGESLQESSPNRVPGMPSKPFPELQELLHAQQLLHLSKTHRLRSQLIHATAVLPRVAQVAHGPGADHQRFDGANHDLVAKTDSQSRILSDIVPAPCFRNQSRGHMPLAADRRRQRCSAHVFAYQRQEPRSYDQH